MNEEKMTGLEWYSRFIDNAKMTDEQVTEFVKSPIALYQHMTAAARKAAGLAA